MGDGGSSKMSSVFSWKLRKAQNYEIKQQNDGCGKTDLEEKSNGENVEKMAPSSNTTQSVEKGRKLGHRRGSVFERIRRKFEQPNMENVEGGNVNLQQDKQSKATGPNEQKRNSLFSRVGEVMRMPPRQNLRKTSGTKSKASFFSGLSNRRRSRHNALEELNAQTGQKEQKQEKDKNVDSEISKSSDNNYKQADLSVPDLEGREIQEKGPEIVIQNLDNPKKERASVRNENYESKSDSEFQSPCDEEGKPEWNSLAERRSSSEFNVIQLSKKYRRELSQKRAVQRVESINDLDQLQKLLDKTDDEDVRKVIIGRLDALKNEPEGDKEKESPTVGGIASLTRATLTVPNGNNSPTTMNGQESTPQKVVARSASEIKAALLKWCQAKTKGYPNVNITNYSKSWSDGLAFCALIHHFYPDAFDFSKLDPKNKRENYELAFRVAEEQADIAALLDVEDMLSMGDNLDYKCVFTYVQQFYRRFHNVP